MPRKTSHSPERSRHLPLAPARSDNEAGVEPAVSDADGPASDATKRIPALTNAELVQLQIRVIALENLVIALLADASGSRRERARAMAAHISPRPGFTRHRLTLHAAAQLTHLVDRAEQFHAVSSPVEQR